MSAPQDLDAYLDALDSYWRNSLCGVLCTTISGLLLLVIGLYGIYYFHSRPRPVVWLFLMVIICGFGVFVSCSFCWKSFCLFMRQREQAEMDAFGRTFQYVPPDVIPRHNHQEEHEMTDLHNLLTTPSPESLPPDQQSSPLPVDGARYHACASYGKSSIDYHVFEEDSDVTADVSSFRLNSDVRHDDDDYEYETQFEMDDFPRRKRTHSYSGDKYGVCDIETQV